LQHCPQWPTAWRKLGTDMTELEWLELKEGDKVKACGYVYDLPPDKSVVRAEPNGLGEVIHVEPGHRTVRFEGGITDVHWSEVNLIKAAPLKSDHYNDLQRRAEEVDNQNSAEHAEWTRSLLLRIKAYWEEPDTPLPPIDIFDEVVCALGEPEEES